MKAALLTLAALLLLPHSATALEAPAIKEWQVPWEKSRPRDPWVHDGQVWFVGQASHYLAHFNPATEEFRRYELPDGSGPHTVIADDRGAWYAGNLKRHIGLVDPQSGDITRYDMPGSGWLDPHTMAFNDQDDIWFTLQGGNRIGFLKTDSGDVKLHPVPTKQARPYGLIMRNDQPWVTLFGSHKLATVIDGKVQEIPLPRKEARPRRLDTTPDGMIWYVDYAKGYLGRYNPEDNTFKEWRAPAANDAAPYGMAADSAGRLWFVETGVSPNRVVGFDPKTETFSEPKAIPSGGGTIRHMFYHKADNAIWFGTDTNTLGRFDLPD